MFRNALKRCILINNYIEYPSISKRFAGHSKWANIKHTKALKDGQRSAMFTKLARQMKVAMQEGGSADPGKNLKLEQIVEQAKRMSMPATTIQNIIKSTQKEKNKCKSYILEIKGPGSCFLLCEIFTDNLHQTKQVISTILRKNSAKFGDSGVKHLFQEKGIIDAKNDNLKEKAEPELLEIATEHAIESGAEEVSILEDNIIQFLCAATALKKVQDALVSLKYEITSATSEFIPVQVQQLSDDDLEACSKLYEKLESVPEVIKLCDNIA